MKDGVKNVIKKRWLFNFIEKFKKASKLKKLLIILLFSFPAIIILFGITAELTSRPTFCRTCHYMEPYYQSWKESSHSNVNCTKCHFPPGIAGKVRGKIEGLVQVVNYLTSSYIRRKPWAEIDNSSCLQSGCHTERLLHGKVGFKNVVFDHKGHIGEMRRGKRLRCTSCHSQIVQGDHMVVTETTCFLCHFKKGESVDKEHYKRLSDCRTCHHWESVPKKDMSKFRYDHTDVVKNNIRCTQCHQNTIVGDGYVPKENCYTCHFDNERLSKYENTKLLHNIHIYKNKIECIQCHLRIQHKVQKISSDDELECTTCHSSSHNEQLQLFTGKDFEGIKGIPNPMFKAGLTCASCHLFHKELMGKASVNIAKAQSCESCHGKGYSKLLAFWQESSKNQISLFKKNLADVSNLVRKTKSGNNKDVLSYVDKAKHVVAFVDQGIPIHNIQYTDWLVNKSYDYLRIALKNAKVNYKLPELKTVSSTPGECYNCHTGIEELSIPFEKGIYPHKVHLVDNKIECKTCHSNARKHGELIIDKKDCNSCHHQKANNENCANCHKNSVEIYSGSFLNSESPGLMFSAETKCSDCHIKEKQLIRPSEKICEDCHDAGYSQTALEWKADVLKTYNDVQKIFVKMKSSKDFVYSFKFAKLEKTFENIRNGSANGMHNYELTIKLLNDLKKELSELKKNS